MKQQTRLTCQKRKRIFVAPNRSLGTNKTWRYTIMSEKNTGAVGSAKFDRNLTDADLKDLANLQGLAASLRGAIASFRGAAASMRDSVGSLRGTFASARGHLASLRGALGSQRGAVASLRGGAGSVRGIAASLRGAVGSMKE
jgi:hypothetical protein